MKRKTFCFVAFVCFFSFLGLFKLTLLGQNVVNYNEYYYDNFLDCYEKEVMLVEYDSDIYNLIANMKISYNRYIVDNKEKLEKVVFCLENDDTFTMYYSDIAKYIE